MEKSICVFGDSTAWGAWDTENGVHPNTSIHKKIFERVRDFLKENKRT